MSRYTEQDWTAEEFSGGGYATVFAPGVATQLAWDPLAPIGNLHFACSDFAPL
jgi:monoamine oxidase